jgi:N-acetylglucosamine malate deacetylase 2
MKFLFIFAHPDDESFACAGTIAKYRDMGHEIALICATSGCKGKSGEYQFDSREKLARHRELELQRAADVLGITKLVLYRYRDGSLMMQEPLEIASRIMNTIMEVKPDVIVTFPPDGVTGHSDHIAICNATNLAILRLDEAGQGYQGDVYFASIPHYYDYCDDSAPRPAVVITGKVDVSTYRYNKAKALQAHRSQVYSLNRAYPGVIDGDISVIGNYEYYTLIRSKGKIIVPIVDSDSIPVIDLVDRTSEYGTNLPIAL